ncbi:transcriptional repressor [Pelagibacteraceae bacterium]|jgi:Fur family zinc uptake transcriptional regulator|nr:transcriptional repressor [Pelagibacteraceae bacterium]|tara:strand:+ start:321 stop:722 length:402 start_codon:yes stop_codon:yes gene_type:complete
MENKQKPLSKNQKIILEYIQKNKKPVKAYSILSNVQKKGINAPPQVYRALDKLIEIGKIHKVESQNSFVACKTSDCETPHATAFSICDSCDEVSEINDPKLFKYLLDFKDNSGIKFDGYNLEFFGTCKSCETS